MRHTRRRALTLMSGIWSAPKPVKGGWHRNDPGDGGGDGTAGGGPAGGGENDGDDDGAGDGKKPKLDGDFDPERAQRALGSAREAEKKAKAAAKEAQDRLAAVLKAAGLTPDGKADPEEQVKALTERATKAEERATQLAIKSAVRDAADEHKANAAELLDSTKFLSQLGELDPTADDYGDKVAKLVAQAVKNNPAKFGTSTAKGGTRSGSSDHTGGNSGSGRSRDLSSAVARKLGG